MRELFEDVLPPLLLLGLVDSRRDEGDETPSPHPGTTGDDVRGEGGAGMVNELSGGVKTLAAVTEKAWRVGLGIKVEKESAVDDCETAMEYIETVLQLNWNKSVGNRQSVSEQIRKKSILKDEMFLSAKYPCMS